MLKVDLLHDKTNPLARLHALWTLAALNAVDAAVVNDVVGDPHPALREHALRVAICDRTQCGQSRWISTGPPGQAGRRSRRFVFGCKRALALGDRAVAKKPAAAPMPWEKSRPKDSGDPWIRLAILSGLAESLHSAFLALCRARFRLRQAGTTVSGSRRDSGVRRRWLRSELSALLDKWISSRVDQTVREERSPAVSCSTP